jgi:hypothetical protein
MFADSVMESSSTTGTGSYTLVGAVGYSRTFAQDFANGDTVAYFVSNLAKTRWEFCTGTLTIGPPRTLTRTVRKSSNAGAAIDWQASDVYYIFSIASADALGGLLAGNLAMARPWWVRTGARWLDQAAGLAVSWIDRLATGAATNTRIGVYDVVKDAYFPDARRPWSAIGAANKTIAAADIPGIFTFDNAAAARTLTLPASNATGVGHGFRVGGLGLTSGGQYGIVLAPAAGDGIEGGVDGASKTIPGGARFDVVWDQASDTWRVEYLNTAQGWETGDYRISSRASTSLPGWVKVDDGTIGNAASGGTTRANADTADLFAHLWNTFSDAICPVSTGRGATAAADFAAGKTIKLSAMLGRALVVAGAGSGLTSRALGDKTGTETSTATTTLPVSGTALGYGGDNSFVRGGQNYTSTAFSVVQPSSFVNVFIKL